MTGISDLDVYWHGGMPVLYAASGVGGGVTGYQLTSSGPQFLDQAGYAPGGLLATPGQLEQVTINGATVLAQLGWHDSSPDCFDLGTNGQLAGIGQLSAQGGFPAALVAMATVSVGGTDYIYASHWDMAGLVVYEVQGTQLVQIAHVDTIGSPVQGADLVTIQQVDVGGQTYVLTASAIDNTVTSYQVGANGVPAPVTVIGAMSGLGLNGISAMVTATMGGHSFVVVAAAGSGSISVLQLGPDGALTPTDHVLDTLDTRFGGVTALEVVSVGGQVFLVAAGADDGVSLLQLLPDGRVLHLAQIADSAETALNNVTALAVNLQGTTLDIFASSQTEAGITHLTVDLNTIGQTHVGDDGAEALTGGSGRDVLMGGGGNDTLRGEAGEDILVDGAGTDSLYGGAGADVFVFTADGQRDDVRDFEIGVDRLDMSGLGLLRNLSQIQIVTETWGATLIYGDEEIRLFSSGGNPISAALFTIHDLIDLPHYNVGIIQSGNDVQGSTGDDTLSGNGFDNTVTGLAGNDSMMGGEGEDTMYGGNGRDTLLGGDGHDTLFGDAGDDVLNGDRGNDMLDGGDDQDVLSGGTGKDTLLGGAGEDTLNGEAGNDSILGGPQSDVINGGLGNDRMFGENGSDTILGGGGNDFIDGGNGGDRLWGGDQDDSILGGQGEDRLYGDAGNDTLRGGSENDVLDGGIYQDRLYGDAGNDTLYGGAGFDWLEGGEGNDRLDGGHQADNLLGGNGNDVLLGGTGFDRLFGGYGDDFLSGWEGPDGMYGQWGNDVMVGQQDNDRMFGGPGNDRMDGGSENDFLSGGAGFDTLIGSTGNDTLRGDFNADTFVFADFGGGFGHDVITDFDANNDLERIDLSRVQQIHNWYDLFVNHMSQVGGNVVIDEGNGNTITLQGVDLGDLDAADFIF